MTDERLPSPMQMEAAGDARPIIKKMARDQRRTLRHQAFDDQAFAAVIERYGGDADTAAAYWRLSRTVHAITRGPAACTTVDEVMEHLEDEYGPELR